MYTFFVGPQISCSGCRNDGEFESDRAATDVDSDHGSVSGKSRQRKKSNGLPRTSSPREPLVVPKDDEQAELMGRLYRNAREMERQLKEDNKRINETRNLTLLDLTDAASCLYGGEPISKDIWRKLEKEDYGLYGITVRQAGASGETILGTTVTSKKGKTGEVVEAKMEEGYNVFTIEWSNGKGNARSAYTTLEVLCYRDDGQAVVSLDEANACMVAVGALCVPRFARMCANLCSSMSWNSEKSSQGCKAWDCIKPVCSGSQSSVPCSLPKQHKGRFRL